MNKFAPYLLAPISPHESRRNYWLVVAAGVALAVFVGML